MSVFGSLLVLLLTGQSAAVAFMLAAYVAFGFPDWKGMVAGICRDDAQAAPGPIIFAAAKALDSSYWAFQVARI